MSTSKGKEKATPEPEVTAEYLASLLQKARDAVASQDDILSLDISHETYCSEFSVPAYLSHCFCRHSLKPDLPEPYLTLGQRKIDPFTFRDPAVQAAEQASSSFVVPAPPVPPPEIGKSGKAMTKRERKALRKQTAGSDWFDLPAPAEADLPRLYREVESLRLRNQLDPKRFYRKEEGEGKGIKGLPKYFAIGTILPSSTPFGIASAENLSRAKRKRTLVDELVDDAEAKRYAKRKFDDLQAVKGAKGRNTLHDKKAKRRPKW
ncbi:rRNA-processing protein fcf2 [Mycena indigotica]|uniref:rRNA-processing protein fcf2 n=1 Tax=Mycena indigotica TaxID=2126181 RepID=A0A8H6SJM2_9AGAR|nr:rRNA-processing protein fcf2 [Mycena indigotica]KAF7299050.1 rRNA-processing protein fcf2 [Mycena indigotica]